MDPINKAPMKNLKRRSRWVSELEDPFSMLAKFESCYEEFSSVAEFEDHLMDECVSSEKSGSGWVYWTPEIDDEGYQSDILMSGDVCGGNTIRERIRRVLTEFTASCVFTRGLVQFWGPKEVGGRRILTTLDQPFAFWCLPYQGLNWYREKCVEHRYIVDDRADDEQLGPPGRVFRDGRPESSPNLGLYSAREFPLRDHAVRCGLISYFALPVFDLPGHQYVGVMEFVGPKEEALFHVRCLSAMRDALKVVEMRTTHFDMERLTELWNSAHSSDYGCLTYHQQQPDEIGETLRWALKAVPELHHAQVRVPCEEHAENSSSFNRMELVASIVKYPQCFDNSLHEFLVASEFHNLPTGQGLASFALSSASKSCLSENVSDFNICEYPLAHYAQQARLSFCFAICVRNMVPSGNNDELYVFEFFLQPQSRDHTYISFVLRSLLKIMNNTLRGFRMATGRQLGEELVVDRVRRGYMSISFDTNTHKNLFELGLEVIPCCLLNAHQQPSEHKFSVPVEEDDERFSSGLREALQKLNLHCLETRESGNDFIFCRVKDEEMLEKGDDSSSTLQLHPATQKIKLLMTKIIAEQNRNKNYLVQFWAQKIIENKPYLSTSGQPFALGYLGERLNSYRKQCMGHLIFVGDGAKEEELGPPGRVFLTGHLESSPDLRLYSTREFPLLEHVVYCGTREYLSLPLFDLQQNQCLGILEFVGFPIGLRYILEKLKEVKLRSTHVNYHLASTEIDDGRKLALAEIKEMFELLKESPQLHYAFAWTPCCQCANMNVEMFCMERVCDMRMVSFDDWNFQKVNIGKGVTGSVLESKNKICFIENFGGLSILESPWAHCAQSARLELCFVVCLQSSHTGDCIYILEFFVSPGSNRFKYPWSYMRFLLCTMRRKLKSFKVASGQQLEADLIYQAIQFGKDNDLQSGTVQRGHEADPMANVEEHEQDSFDVNSNLRNKRNESKTSLPVSNDDLEPRLGKGLNNATNKLGVSGSTLKRTHKERCHSNVKNKRNQMETSNKVIRNYDQQVYKQLSTNLPISDFSLESSVRHTCIKSAGEVDQQCQETDIVIVKVKYEDVFVKLFLFLSWGLEKLKYEVAWRLKLMTRNFELAYEYENGLITLTCDEDLHQCAKRMRLLGNYNVQVSVHLVPDHAVSVEDS